MVGVSVFVIVPARGGSKGIPGKNLRPVAGVPLVARAVVAARAAASVDRVFVSTDDVMIAHTAREAGAEVIDRPPTLAVDEASSESALLHALDWLSGQGTPLPDVTVMVQCTSPFIDPADVDATVRALEAENADCAFTAARTHAFLWRVGPNGAVAVNHDGARRARRQEREPELVETGAVYAMRTAGLLVARHRFFGKIAIAEVPPERAIEIDEPGDLARADAFAAILSRREACAGLPPVVRALVLDFDGVLTDNQVITMQDGTEGVASNRSDGHGLEQLRAAGLPIVVLSREDNPVVAARCEKLQLECLQGRRDKVSALRSWLSARGIDAAATVFVGNDTTDVGCLRMVGCGVVVADAHPDALVAADLVLTRAGGRGAVRELADLLLTRLEEVGA
jgi:N-acylneuraminate cytidylyltransferase